MLTTALPIMLALAGAVQDAPPAAQPETRREVRFMFGGPDGGRHMDKDGDGFVTREEFTAPMADAFGRLDANSDGRISSEEFAAHRPDHDVMMMRHGGPGPHRFEIRRPRGDGAPGERHEERVIILDGPGGRHGPMGHGVVHGGPGDHVFISRMGPEGRTEMDANKDGRVTEDEFVAPLREAFKRMDKNNNGELDADERGTDREVRVITRREESSRGG